MSHALETFEQLGADMASETPEFLGMAVRLEHHFPDSITTRFASEVTIQLDRAGCFISFFEVRPPLVLGTPEEIKAQMEKVDSIRAECVARVFLPSYKMPEFLSALQSMVSASAAMASLPITDSSEKKES